MKDVVLKMRGKKMRRFSIGNDAILMEWETLAWPLGPFEKLSFPHYEGRLNVPQGHDLQAITAITCIGRQ